MDALVTHVEPWNRVEVPKPAIHCIVTVPFSDVTGKNVGAITKECHVVRALLKSKVLASEVKVLRAILYINHNPLGSHSTYLALKQVQQCLNRLTTMNLESSIQDFVELFPNKKDMENTEVCSVPSQPLIEFVAVKILGGCKLLLRLLDSCCKAFHLTVQHLCLKEYIVLNVVVLGLLSRLWVLFRGILKSLTPIYGPLYGLLQDVSMVQKMPYFKGFTFPLNIIDFLGPGFSDVVPQRLTPKIPLRKGVTKLLNKLFPGAELLSKPRSASASTVRTKVKTKNRPVDQSLDVGKPVWKKRRNIEKLPEFDIKSLCKKHQLNPSQETTPALNIHSTKKDKSSIVSSSACLGSESIASITSFLPKIQRVESFKELSVELQAAVKWCRTRKLKSNVLFLGNRCLKSKRLSHLESQGYSRKKKLRCMKASVCRYLLCGTGNIAFKRSSPRKLKCRKMYFNKNNAVLKLSRLKSAQEIKISTKKTFKGISEHFQPEDITVRYRGTETIESSCRAKSLLETGKLPVKPYESESSVKIGIDCSIDKDDIDDIFEGMDF
ncbi:nucleolus and neural progenitor protein isoform X2 [Lissotriton helveticus]